MSNITLIMGTVLAVLSVVAVVYLIIRDKMGRSGVNDLKVINDHPGGSNGHSPIEEVNLDFNVVSDGKYYYVESETD